MFDTAIQAQIVSPIRFQTVVGETVRITGQTSGSRDDCNLEALLTDLITGTAEEEEYMLVVPEDSTCTFSTIEYQSSPFPSDTPSLSH